MNTDEWHPASEPPKPEDFEPTTKIDLLWSNENITHQATRKTLSGYIDWTHWRKITPPK